jgi:nucleoside-diphosphate-sugar epimerase
MTFDRILVTGGAGFIGSHTVDALVMNDTKVWILDNLSTGRLANLRRWRNEAAVRFAKGSITKLKTIESVTRRVDAIIHLAAVSSPSISTHRPELTNDVNVSGTLNVLKAGVKSQVKRIVLASSASVYGNARFSHVKEDAPLSPITPYAASKVAAEKYCEAFYHSYSLDTISLRYFNVYGERQDTSPYSGVIAIFSDKLTKGIRPIIYGGGTQTRDFIHVSDVTRANLLALASRAGQGEAFNIGTGHATTINELYRLLAITTGKQELRPISRPRRTIDIMNSCADPGRARRLLGFRAAIDLRSGLKLLLKSKPTKKR